MYHRHLEPQGFTLSAIDDIIARGSWSDWKDLRRAVLSDEQVRGKVQKVCEPQLHDPYAQRYHFWMIYVTARAAQTA